MKVLFDNIIFSLQSIGGVSVVWYEFLSRILKAPHLERMFLEYADAKNNIFREKLSINESDIYELNKRFFIFKRFFDLKIKINSTFLFHSSYYRISSNPQAINITTVHDFTYEYFVKGLKKKIHCWQKHRAIHKSDYILCISESTKKDLLKFMPNVDENKITVIYNGVSEEYRPLSDSKFIDYPFKAFSYVLFIGSREKYKNFSLAVEAVSKTNLNLIIVGGTLSVGEIVFLNKLLGVKKYCHKKGIPNEELNVLYNNAFCLLYPSSYEGFGIPVLEAQKAGCPVIAYNASSIPEIIGKTPLLMNKLSIDEILDKINILQDSSIRKKIIEAGLENAQKYSWDKMFNDIMDLYAKAYQKRINMKNDN